jgi:anti-anti-sigma regulatory factor
MATPSGEIDLATVDAFRDDLYDIIDLCDAPIVRVDLQAVTFITSCRSGTCPRSAPW